VQSVPAVSRPVTVIVRPLPDAGRPDDFSGLVGSFAIRSTLAKKGTVKENQAVDYEVK